MLKGTPVKLPALLWLVLAVIFIISFTSLAISLNILGTTLSIEQSVIYDYNAPR
ncbi:MAG: hypothetical protein Q8P32_00160 [Candidatus Komeilibacteria bacterium]|nr:hypothetical protein [Candidatus Komeilibacteria bacterium]